MKRGIVIAHIFISALFVLGCIGGNCTHNMAMRTVTQAIVTADLSFNTIMWMTVVLLPMSILLGAYLFGRSNRWTRIALLGIPFTAFGLIMLIATVSGSRLDHWFPYQGIVTTIEVFVRGLPEPAWDDFNVVLASASWWFIFWSILLIKEIILANEALERTL